MLLYGVHLQYVLLCFQNGMGLKSSSYVFVLFSSVFQGCLENEADALNWGGKNRSGEMS